MNKDLDLMKQILNEIKEIKTTMATNDDLQKVKSSFSATQNDLQKVKESIATKDDLQKVQDKMATKDDIQSLKELINAHRSQSILADEKLLEIIDELKSDVRTIHDRLDHQIGRIAKTEEFLDILQRRLPQ